LLRHSGFLSTQENLSTFPKQVHFQHNMLGGFGRGIFPQGALSGFYLDNLHEVISYLLRLIAKGNCACTHG
ncbi:hypothetical protein, partial [Brucella endophytica]